MARKLKYNAMAVPKAPPTSNPYAITPDMRLISLKNLTKL
jgi:hypothetical protein